jgi:hypothetical protein
MSDGSTATAPIAATAPARRVRFFFGLGILLMPYVFAWFLLRKGYSATARVVGFGWMVAAVAVLSMHASDAAKNAVPASDNPATNGAPNESATAREADGSHPSDAAKKAFLGVHRQFVAAVAPCDNSARRMAHVDSRYGAYNQADALANNCVWTAQTIDALVIAPPVSHAAKASIGAALKACAGAYSMRTTFARKAQGYVNGDMRPSDAQDVEMFRKMAEAAIAECTVKYVMAVKAAGYEIPRH